MLEHSRSSPPIASCPTCSRTKQHPCWLGRGTAPQSGRIHPIGGESPTYLTTLLDAANSTAALPRKKQLPSRSRQLCKTPSHPIVIIIIIIITPSLARYCKNVLKSTKQVNGKVQNSTPRHTKTPQPIFTKIGMRDYVMDGTQQAKFCSDRFTGFCFSNQGRRHREALGGL